MTSVIPGIPRTGWPLLPVPTDSLDQQSPHRPTISPNDRDRPSHLQARSLLMTMQDTNSSSTTQTPTSVVLSDSAAAKVKSLLEQEGRRDLALRIAVQPGGCSGLRYQLFFDERTLEGDQLTDFGGVKVVVDKMS